MTQIETRIIRLEQAANMKEGALEVSIYRFSDAPLPDSQHIKTTTGKTMTVNYVKATTQ